MRQPIRNLPNAQQRAEGKAFMKKEVQKFVMSKGVGKVLDSKIGKLGVNIGNKIIKGIKTPGRLLDEKLRENEALEKAKDAKYKKQGIKNNRDFSGY